MQASDEPLAEALRQARLHSAAGRDDAALAALAALIERVAQMPAPPAEALLLQGQALATRGEVLIRRAQYAAALQAMARAVTQLGGRGGERDRLYGFSAMAFCFMHLGLPEQGLRAASAGRALAERYGMPAAEAMAQSMVGMCCGLLGDAVQAEGHGLRALGLLQQQQDPVALRMCLNNLVHFANQQADHFRAEGEDERAEDVLLRCTRHVSRGTQINWGAGSHDESMWRSNRAGWLRRRGRLDEAETEYAAVAAAAAASDWIVTEREAVLGLGEIAFARGDAPGAAAAFERVLAISDAPDGFELLDRAHERLATLALKQGDGPLALQHETTRQALATARAEQRAAVLERLHELESTMAQAVGEEHHRRVEAEIARLRRLRA